MSQRTKIQALVVLLAVAVVAYLHSRNESPVMPSVLSADTHFQALNVKDPILRLDLLQKEQQENYSGSHRNIFVAAPPPPPPAARVPVPRPFVGPVQPPPPPPPPPLQVPVEFFGMQTSSRGKRMAFFKSGDDILTVNEGDTFLNRFRLVHIGNESADVEETSSGRHATVPLVQDQSLANSSQSQN